LRNKHGNEEKEDDLRSSFNFYEDLGKMGIHHGDVCTSAEIKLYQ
jgi:hypothetical protein